PDVLAPAPGAALALTYPDGRGAAIAKPGVIFVGFPVETIVPVSARAALFEKALAFLAPGIARGDLDLDGASDACEEEHGLDPTDFRDGAEDADGDGVTNAAECQAGTNPRDGLPPLGEGEGEG